MRGYICLFVAACGGSDSMMGDDTPVPDGSGPFFEESMFWNRDVSGVSKAANSDAMIASIRAAGGWGNGDKFQIDFSFDVLGADASTPMKTFNTTGDFYDPDCDHVPVPVPTNGNIEGETGYSCTSD